VSANTAAPPNEDDLAVARFQGKRVTQVARALKAAQA
jgi:NAD(P)H dehydrogenase (quinone)